MIEKKVKNSVVIPRPDSRMRSEIVIEKFLIEYWGEWNDKSMAICSVKTGLFKLFISMGYEIASFTLSGTRQEIYNDIIDNKTLNAKLRKLKIHALLNPIDDSED